MTAGIMSKETFAATGPELVAPLVGFLVSEQNKVSGGIFEVGGGWIARTRWQRAAGAYIKLQPEGNFSVEKVKEEWKNAVDFSDPTKVSYPTTTASQMAEVVKNVPGISANNRRSKESMKAAQEAERAKAKL